MMNGRRWNGVILLEKEINLKVSILYVVIFISYIHIWTFSLMDIQR